MHYFVLFVAFPLSIDHKPDRSDERERIEQAGGFIIWAGEIYLLSLLKFLFLFHLLNHHEKWVIYCVCVSNSYGNLKFIVKILARVRKPEVPSG